MWAANPFDIMEGKAIQRLSGAVLYNRTFCNVGSILPVLSTGAAAALHAVTEHRKCGC